MSKLGEITLTGASGNEYDFDVYSYDTEFKNIGPIYYISNRNQKPKGDGFSHSSIYIGETEELEDRLSNHHKKNCFDEHDANAISVHSDTGENSRLAKEADLN